MRLTAADVADALKLPAPPGLGAGGPPVFTGVSTDTRTLQPGDLFVALVSPKADGHGYIPQALAAGAAGLVVSQDTAANVATFRVPDTQVAYGQLARWWRNQSDIPVIGVTGSVGKTTVKEMIAAALGPLGPILKTAASQNNETGVPKALLQLTSEHRAAVIEMGMRGAGQIAYLCGIARPTVGVLTVISDNHAELLGSRDAIADAKGELLQALPADGLAILNADDPYFERLQQKTAARVMAYGVNPPARNSGGGGDLLTADAGSARVGEGGLRFAVRGVPVEIASPSRHDIGNALAALAVADTLGVPLAAAADALKQYTPPPMRMQIVKTPWGGTVLNDAYNAAPASMRSALETLKNFAGGRKIAFLGDMKELGDNAHRAHQALGEAIAELGGLDALYAVGGLAAQIPGATEYWASSAEAADFARGSLAVQSGDVILVKGSRAMAMERIADTLTARPLAPPELGAGGRSSPPGAGGSA
ncbi:MAG: UDP-N-acetylmuramoyl-tripeptide--D-alanyl-D-alanine ligase [Armatimonadetes bacterium]|nr:UDP-N-acetylmuramoyl-tripeptide--D-alanyl-D-alanine ligase [Armatimonadota bacterium]